MAAKAGASRLPRDPTAVLIPIARKIGGPNGPVCVPVKTHSVTTTSSAAIVRFTS